MKTQFIFISFIILTSLLAVTGINRAIAGEDIKNLKINLIWKDENGHYLIEFQDGFETSRNFFYGDRQSLYQMDSLGFSNGKDSHGKVLAHSEFFEPRLNGQGEVWVNIDGKGYPAQDSIAEIVCGKHRSHFIPLALSEIAEILIEIQTGKIPLLPLPSSARKSQYLLKSKNTDMFYYVDDTMFGDDYGGPNMRLWAGPLGDMRELKIDDVDATREGDASITFQSQSKQLYTSSMYLKATRENGSDGPWLWSRGSKADTAFVLLDLEEFDLAQLGIPEVPPVLKLHTPCDRFFEE